MAAKKLFVASENKNVCDFLTSFAEKDGFTVKCICDISAVNCEKAIKECLSFSPDIAILDEDFTQDMKDNFFRSLATDVYVISDREGKDHLPLPFDIAKLTAVFSKYIPKQPLQCEDMEVIQSPAGVAVGNLHFPLTLNELEVLKYFIANPNRVFSREQLAYEVFGADASDAENLAENTVSDLKEKLDGVSGKWSLKLLWGVGYKFEVLR